MLVQLITNAAPEMRVKLLFLIWRVWHHRRNIVHGDGKASVAASIPFLQNYLREYAEVNSIDDPSFEREDLAISKPKYQGSGG
jgi:hypothetical protein